MFINEANMDFEVALEVSGDCKILINFKDWKEKNTKERKIKGIIGKISERNIMRS